MGMVYLYIITVVSPLLLVHIGINYATELSCLRYSLMEKLYCLFETPYSLPTLYVVPVYKEM